MYYEIKAAGYPVIFLFRNSNTYKYFSDGIVHDDCIFNDNIVTIPEAIIYSYMMMNGCKYEYSEYMNALYMVSNYLLQYNICSFHSVAIRVNNKGYLITAESGVGKTTQYHNLKNIYSDEIEIINGDKPFLEFLDDNKIMIHPSPWQGKENYGNNIICELAGVIFLKQASYNKIRKVKPEEIVVSSLGQFLYQPDQEETVHKVCDLDRRLIMNTPLWILYNTGNLDSSRLLYQSVLSGDEL